MVGPIAVDTPDYQRGIVNAQKQLAFVNYTSDVVTVGVPPNAETLVIATPTNSLSSTPVCLGLTTALNYPAVRVAGYFGPLGAIHWMFDISSALDAQVQITWPGARFEQWWVYADAGVRLTVNPTQTSNAIGQQYVIPSVPSTLMSDHPPNEMQCTFNYGTTTQVFMGPPGAGYRYRLFTLELTGDNTTGSWEMMATGNVDGPYIHVAGVNATVIPLHPQGYPMPANTGLTVAGDAAGGTWRASVWHTTETV